MPIEVKYFKPINGDPNRRYHNAERAGSIQGFGLPSQYIRSISLPQKMFKGGEYVPTSEESIIEIQRSTSVIKEFFSPPFFTITKKIRIQFHWDGIEIVGSSMNTPNCFTLPIPSNTDVNKWYLKIICKSTASIGLKPLYISVDTYHENVLLKWVFRLVKILSLLALIVIPILILIFGNAPLI